MQRYILSIFATVCTVAVFVAVAMPSGAQAAITESGPPISGTEIHGTVGGGSIVPLIKFRLRGDGSTAIDKVGFTLRASSTLSTPTELDGVALYRESNNKFGFQYGTGGDALVGGAYLSNPATSTLLLLSVGGSGYVPSSGGDTEFFIVASTSATSNIVNGDSFDATLDANYASTTGPSPVGIGSAYLPMQKVTLEQTASLYISEIGLGSSGRSADEFVEIYNRSDIPIDLSKLPLNLYLNGSAGGARLKTITYDKQIIPGFGYFLIAEKSFYSGSTDPDASYDASDGFSLVANGGVIIATSSVVANATSSAIDLLGFDAQPTANCKATLCFNPTGGVDVLPLANSLERKSQEGSDASGMYQLGGGADALKGNGFASTTAGNAIEFVIQTVSAPQNSLSPSEFPFSGFGGEGMMGEPGGPGGSFDSQAPTVSDSFPRNGDTNVPIDRMDIGFSFSEPMNGLTVQSASATTTVTLTAAGSNTNLCSRIEYNPNGSPQARCMFSGSLAPSTVYTFTVASTTRDVSGNALDQNSFTEGAQDFSLSFTTGSAGFTQSNQTPPSVNGTSPFSGSSGVSRNITSISIEFNQFEMKTSTLNSSNITLASNSGPVTLSSFSFSTSTGKAILSAAIGSTLASDTDYTITVGTGVQTSTSASMYQPYTARFRTSIASDTTAPQVVAVLPTSGTTIAAGTGAFIFTFDDNMDASTATSGSVRLSTPAGLLPGTVIYDPIGKEGRFVPSSVLPLNATLTMTLVGASLKNVSGIALGSNKTYTWTTESSNSDVSAPRLQFVRATDFEINATFDEAVKQTDAENISNYTLTAGGSSVALSALGGQSVRYDATNLTAKITGIRLTSGQAFTLSVSNVRDISGNRMTSANFSGTIEGFADGGGMGPGMGTGSSFGEMKDFSASGIGFVPSVNIRPTNNFVSQTSAYAFELPVSTQIPANGTIVITFPNGSSFDLSSAATSSANDPYLNSQNLDVNGPGPGTIGVKTFAKDTVARTLSLTLDGATRSENGDTHDFLRFAVAGIRNPSVPKSFDSAGYVLDIKSFNSSGAMLESFSGNPIYITGGSSGGGATTTVQGIISGNGGVVIGANVYLESPQTGRLSTQSSTGGAYSFSNVPINSFGGGSDYMLSTDPFISDVSDANGATTTSFFGSPMPSPTRATSSSIITRNFALTSSTNAINFAVKVTAGAATFGASENVDVFAGGPGQFVVKTVAPGAGSLTASTIATVNIPQVNGMWGIGMGPAMPKGGSAFQGPPPAVTWAAPAPINIMVTGCPDACVATYNGATLTSHTFVISSADKTISGVLKDGSGNTIANAQIMVFSPTLRVGSSGSTATDGGFSVNVAAGDYNVSAFVPGVGKSRDVPVVVSSGGSVFVDGATSASTGKTGLNPFTLKMSKPSYTITGQVTDGTNPLGNAPVFAYRTDAPGHADTMTDSSTGNYTLYVDNGTWKVSSRVPGFGGVAEQTVVMAGTSASGINFSPSASATFSVLSGNLYVDTNSNNAFDAGEGVSGSVVRVSGSGGNNEGNSGNDGAYSVRVPAANGYRITDVFNPQYGRIAPLGDDGLDIGAIDLTASTTQNIRIAPLRSVTFSIKDSDGSLMNIGHAGIDLLDTATNYRNHAEIWNTSSVVMQVPDLASTTVRVFLDGVPQGNVTIASDDAGTVVVGGVVKVNGTEAVKIVVNTSSAALSTLSGTVYVGTEESGNELDNAWVQLMDPTNNIFLGTQATSSGRYSIKLQDGTYQIMVSKPGYISAPTSVTVSGGTTKNMVMTSASLTISGSVTAGGSIAKNAFVRASKVGGGQSIAQTDTAGNFSLPVTAGTWRLFAVADGYAEAAHSGNPIVVTSASLTDKNITLSTAVSLQSTLATSNTFTDTSAGTFRDATVGVNITLDANSLGSSGNSSYFTARETSNVPNTDSVTVVADKAKEINAFSGDSQVTTLQSGKTANVDLTYTKAELAGDGVDTTSEVRGLTVSTYKESLKEWKSLSTVPTYLDSDGNVVAEPASDLSNVSTVQFTAVTDTFSAFALTASTGATPPDVPTGLTATAVNVSGEARVNLAWTASSGAEGYYIYRDTSATGSFPLLVDAGNVTSYQNNTLQPSTAYYYKVAAYKSSGAQESAASSAVSVTTTAATVTTSSSGGGGGGGYAYYSSTPVASTTITTTVATPVVSATGTPLAVTPTPKTVTPAAISPSTMTPGTVGAIVRTVARFMNPLKLGKKSAEVLELQKFLNSDPDTLIAQTGAGSPGNETTYYGPATTKAIEKFQLKYGIAKKGDVGFGNFGPATRAKVNELLEGGTVSPLPTTLPTTPEARAELIKTLQSKLLDLMRQLATMLAAQKAGN